MPARAAWRIARARLAHHTGGGTLCCALAWRVGPVRCTQRRATRHAVQYSAVRTAKPVERTSHATLQLHTFCYDADACCMLHVCAAHIEQLKAVNIDDVQQRCNVVPATQFKVLQHGTACCNRSQHNASRQLCRVACNPGRPRSGVRHRLSVRCGEGAVDSLNEPVEEARVPKL